MVQWLKALATLPEVQSSNPSITSGVVYTGACAHCQFFTLHLYIELQFEAYLNIYFCISNSTEKQSLCHHPHTDLRT